MPNFEQPIVVASLAALADVHVAELDDGTLAYVQSLLSFFVLEKSNGTAANGVTIIAPNPGSPIAGAAGARWVFLVVAGAGALVTPFRMLPVPSDITGSVVFVDLLVVPGGVDVLVAGDVLLDFDASTLMTPSGTAAAFNGPAFQFLWDGAPLADNSFYETDVQAADVFNTFAECVRFRSLIVGAAAGNHTLSVQWAVNDATDTVASFTGSGNLTIQSAPR